MSNAYLYRFQQKDRFELRTDPEIVALDEMAYRFELLADDSELISVYHWKQAVHRSAKFSIISFQFIQIILQALAKSVIAKQWYHTSSQINCSPSSPLSRRRRRIIHHSTIPKNEKERRRKTAKVL